MQISFPIPLPAQGVHQEVDPIELTADALENSENWIFRDGRLRVRDGIQPFGDNTADRPNGFSGYRDDDGSAVLLLGTDDTVFRFNESTRLWADLSAAYTAGVKESTLFSVFQLGSAGGPATTVYIQNGIDRAKKWSLGDATVTNVAAIPTSRAQMVVADRLILGNLIDHASSTYAGAVGPSIVTVSAGQNPEAGYDLADGLVNDLADTPGEIVAMQALGNLQGVIYKTDSIYIATQSDSIDPFTFQMQRANVAGPVGRRAVVAGADGLHYYLALDGNVMAFDGINPTPLGRHIQRYVLNTWNLDVAYKAHGVYDDENRELVFFYAQSGSSEPDRQISIRLDNMSLWPSVYNEKIITAATKASLPGGQTIGQFVGNIGAQTLPLDQYSSPGKSFLYGELMGQCYISQGLLDVTNPVVAFLDTGTSRFDDPLAFKSVSSIDFLFNPAAASQNISVTLRRSNYGEPLANDSVRTIDIGTEGPYMTYHRFPGRAYALRASVSATQQVIWRGSVITYAKQGQR